MLVYLIIAVGWLVVAGVNIHNGAHWSSIVFNVVLALAFAVLGVRKAIRSGPDEEDKNGKKK